MSSTNRGIPRNKDDQYMTPEWCVDLLLKYEKVAGKVLEPCCGTKNIVNRLIKNGVDRNNILTMDIGEKFEPDILTDFTKIDLGSARFDVVVTNPPFIFAQEFLDKCLAHSNKVIFLLRLNYLESKSRYQFFMDNSPKCVYVMSERPKFFNNKTDSIAYAWFVWEKGLTDTRLRVISKREVI